MSEKWADFLDYRKFEQSIMDDVIFVQNIEFTVSLLMNSNLKEDDSALPL